MWNLRAKLIETERRSGGYQGLGERNWGAVDPKVQISRYKMSKFWEPNVQYNNTYILESFKGSRS